MREIPVTASAFVSVLMVTLSVSLCHLVEGNKFIWNKFTQTFEESYSASSKVHQSNFIAVILSNNLKIPLSITNLSPSNAHYHCRGEFRWKKTIYCYAFYKSSEDIFICDYYCDYSHYCDLLSKKIIVWPVASREKLEITYIHIQIYISVYFWQNGN